MGLQPSWQHVHHSYEEDMAQSGRKQRWTVPPSHARDLLLAAGQRPGARDVSTAAHLLRRHWGRCVFQRQSPKQSGQRDSAWGSCASSTLPAVWSEGHGAQTALLDETGLQLRNHKVAANPGPWKTPIWLVWFPLHSTPFTHPVLVCSQDTPYICSTQPISPYTPMLTLQNLPCYILCQANLPLREASVARTLHLGSVSMFYFHPLTPCPTVYLLTLLQTPSISITSSSWPHGLMSEVIVPSWEHSTSQGGAASPPNASYCLDLLPLG